MLRDIKYTFTTEDGSETMTASEYEKRDDLRALFGLQANPPVGRNTAWLGTDTFSFGKTTLQKDPKRAALFDSVRREYQKNPLRYFVPQSEVGLDFLNWRAGSLDGTFKILCAGNGYGKTTLAYIDVMLEMIQCDPKWEIFTKMGVTHRDYRGPQVKGGAAVISYEMKNHELTIWPQVIKQWTPWEYIADYVTGKKSLMWRNSPKFDLAGTPFFFLCLSQAQAAFESQALNTYWWDEQGDEPKFNGANARVRRRGGRHVQAMTPHAIDGMSNTGAGTYVDKVRKGEMDVGMDVRFWEASVVEVADWVYTKEAKAAAIREWIEDPIRTGNKKKLAEGMARVHGKFHEKSGLVFDDFDKQVHVVPDFDIPKGWSYYRYQDHGRKEPCAAILVAVSPSETRYICGEYYEAGKEIKDNARGIVEDMTGNELKLDEFDGRLDEVESNIPIIRTRGDPRSLSKSLDNADRTIGDEYERCGLRMAAGSGKYPETLVPLFGNMLSLDMDKDHINLKDEAGLPLKGAPGVYILERCKNLIWELDHWRMKQTRTFDAGKIAMKEKPESKDDHLCTACLLMAEDAPVYIPNIEVDKTTDILDNRDDEDDSDCCIETGY